MDYKQKTVLITGAGSGIGRTAAKMYAAAGANVVVSDVNLAGGEQTVSSIEEAGGTAVFIKTDVADYAQVKALVERTVERFGQLDVAINNAGIGDTQVRTHEADVAGWERVIAVNQTGVFYCMQHELRRMMQQGSGSIVNVASIAGLKGMPKNIAYSASKHAVIGMTRTAAMEYAKFGIRINALCPVFTPTGLFNPANFPPHIMETFENAIPMKRFATVEEMGKTLLYLTSDAASFITGHALPVDGGLIA